MSALIQPKQIQGFSSLVLEPPSPLVGVTSKTDGAQAIVQEELGVGLINTVTVQYAQGVQSYWEVAAALPDWTGGPIFGTPYWYATTGSVAAAVIGLQGVAVSDGGALAVGYGAAQEVTTPNQGSNVLNIGAESPAVVVAGAVGDPQYVQFRIYRLGSGADVLAATLKLLYMRIRYPRA